MKYIFVLALFFSVNQLKAQKYEDIEVKVISSKYQIIKDQLNKVTAEGIGVADYAGNYFILRPKEITKIKVSKRGLTIGQGAGGGALISLEQAH